MPMHIHMCTYVCVHLGGFCIMCLSETSFPKGLLTLPVSSLPPWHCLCPTSEFPKPLLWSMSHFRFFIPIIVLKGTSASKNLYLGRVSRSGNSQFNVNMILGCWGQFPTFEVTLSTSSLIGKAGVRRPGAETSGREEGGEVGVEEMKVPESEKPSWKPFIYPLPNSHPYPTPVPPCSTTQLS